MISYKLGELDKRDIKSFISKYVRNEENKYNKNPDHYHIKCINTLREKWLKIAIAKACFDLFVRDGLACINKIADDYYSFSDHAGDSFCPVVNGDMDSDLLKRQERQERARFNQQGCFIMTLTVLNNEVDSIGGFVGDDFYSSGYDTDFYNTTFDLLRDNDKTSEYVSQIIDFIVNLSLSEDK